jgi:RimJ/RimL family protein N-acetyltransferase/nitroimidazol reductase NimA-like FMN-containing flavoprotein (pyridoxamine 5'-phosphate oxidase superfamily)
MGTYLKTERTTANRDRDRMSYDAEVVHQILDEAYVCHLGFSSPDGGPRVLPTLHVRVGDTLYLHGSTGSRPLLAARSGDLPVCVTVTLLDGLVFARSQFHHSANYRSVIAHGQARLVTDEAEKLTAFTALVEKVAAGRAADSRPPVARELAQTAVLALRLAEVSAKIRSGGGVAEEPEDYALPYWAGVVPLKLVAGRPIPDRGVSVSLPSYLREPHSAWHTAPTLCGRHVAIEPLDLTHVDGLFAALGDEEVWRHLSTPRPATAGDLVWIIEAALADPNRVPMVQKAVATGEIVGSTSYYAADPVNRSVAIGHTMLGRKWWRTAFNTESKLLLMSRAFDDLGAVRVEWHTDLRNERSQHAIQRLGATREGVLRQHRRRPDGTWRDTVLFAMTRAEWPAARLSLSAALAPR